MHSSWRLLCYASIISLGGSFHYGYQLMVTNPTEDIFKKFINDSFYHHYHSYLDDTRWSYLWPILVNAQTIGALIGTFFIKYLSEKFGRKKCFYFTNSASLLAAAFQGGSKIVHVWELFAIGRLLAGVAQGVQLGVQPMYFNEISPKSRRGTTGSITGFTVEFGFLFGSVAALPMVLGGDGAWPFMFLVDAAPSIVTLTVLPCLPESPKFLASRNDFENAEKALRFFGRNDAEIREELAEIRKELAALSADKNSAMSTRKILSTPYIRKGVLLGWLVNFSSIYSGIAALSYFSTMILENSGLSKRDAQFGTIGITAPCCFGAFLAGFVVDRFGRRPILLIAYTALLSLNVLFVIFANLARVHMVAWAAYPNVVVASLVCLAFGTGPANIVYFLTAELVPQTARSTAHMWAMIVQRFSVGSAALIFYPLNKAINEFCFLLHIIPLATSIACVAVFLPETKNRSTLEIMRQLGFKGDEDGNGKMKMEKF